MATIEEYRTDLQTLTGLAESDLAVLWRQADSADIARELLMDVLPDLVSVYGSAAATLGADWYDETRDEAEVPGRFRAIPTTLPDRGRTDAMARWGVSPLFTAEPDFTSSLTLVLGGLQRIIADASRYTVAGSAVADPGADGWQRSASGGCPFCQMIASRGAVFTESSADFASHDSCRCVAAPAWSGQPRPVKPYKPSLRESTEADRARVREYLRTH